MGEGGSVDDRTVAEAAAGVHRILAAIDAGELACSAAYRNRLQGAVVALDSVAAGSTDYPPEFLILTSSMTIGRTSRSSPATARHSWAGAVRRPK
jgi:hypothetical protein